MKNKFIFSVIAAILTLLFLATGCSKKSEKLIATMKTNHGTIVIELFEDVTPVTVQNFVGLADGTKTWTTPTGEEKREPYYDGLTFHRVIKGFGIHGGCPMGNGAGGPGYQFDDECYAGHYESLEGKITDENMANDIFNLLMVPYFKNSQESDRNPAVVEMVKTMTSQKSYKLMIGMTVEQIGELVGNPDPVRKFVKELAPVTGEITSAAVADTVFNSVIAPHLLEHGGVSPILAVKALHDEVMEANAPDPLIGKTVEELKDLVGSDVEVLHPILLKKVEYGSICMANSGPNTNRSQFFIITNESGADWLEGKHTVFGKVIEGMDVVLKIQEVEYDERNKPIEDVKILSLRSERI